MSEQEKDPNYVLYLFTDDDGKVHHLKLEVRYLQVVQENIQLGIKNARTARSFLELLNTEDTDGTRRHFRAAIAYLIEEKRLVICSTTSGYFVAENAAEVEACVANKERQARSNLKRAALLRSMDIEKSKEMFLAQQPVAAAA